mmetsp:Transcript_130560/g.279097  ORF Transcript_130560/g.279097 Transcript_130560/m.279097 type:complete len:1049 (-) Transcript_130560:68-3214(-)
MRRPLQPPPLRPPCFLAVAATALASIVGAGAGEVSLVLRVDTSYATGAATSDGVEFAFEAVGRWSADAVLCTEAQPGTSVMTVVTLPGWPTRLRLRVPQGAVLFGDAWGVEQILVIPNSSKSSFIVMDKCIGDQCAYSVNSQHWIHSGADYRIFAVPPPSCRAPGAIENAAVIPCEEGRDIGHVSACTARCIQPFTPTVASLTCSDGTLSPATFSCIRVETSKSVPTGSIIGQCLVWDGMDCVLQFWLLAGFVTLVVISGPCCILAYCCFQCARFCRQRRSRRSKSGKSTGERASETLGRDDVDDVLIDVPDDLPGEARAGILDSSTARVGAASVNDHNHATQDTVTKAAQLLSTMQNMQVERETTLLAEQAWAAQGSVCGIMSMCAMPLKAPEKARQDGSSRSAPQVGLAMKDLQVVGTWMYGMRTAEYHITRSGGGQLCFHEILSSGRQVSGLLRPQGEWLQAELHYDEGDPLGTIRVRPSWEGRALISNFRNPGTAEWTEDVFALRASLEGKDSKAESSTTEVSTAVGTSTAKASGASGASGASAPTPVSEDMSLDEAAVNWDPNSGWVGEPVTGPQSSSASHRSENVNLLMSPPPSQDLSGGLMTLAVAPECLRVDAPNSASCEGNYILDPNARPNGQPLWKKAGLRRWLYCGTDGKWYIGGRWSREKTFHCSAGYIFYDTVHEGVPPHQLRGCWKRGNGSAWEEDPSIKITPLHQSGASSTTSASRPQVTTPRAPPALAGGEDKPGQYFIVQDNLPVSCGVATSAPVVECLSAGSLVGVKEVARFAEAVQGRIETPPGWITLLDTRRDFRSAKRQLGPGPFGRPSSEGIGPMTALAEGSVASNDTPRSYSVASTAPLGRAPPAGSVAEAADVVLECIHAADVNIGSLGRWLRCIAKRCAVGNPWPIGPRHQPQMFESLLHDVHAIQDQLFELVWRPPCIYMRNPAGDMIFLVDGMPVRQTGLLLLPRMAELSLCRADGGGAPLLSFHVRCDTAADGPSGATGSAGGAAAAMVLDLRGGRSPPIEEDPGPATPASRLSAHRVVV